MIAIGLGPPTNHPRALANSFPSPNLTPNFFWASPSSSSNRWPFKIRFGNLFLYILCTWPYHISCFILCCLLLCHCWTFIILELRELVTFSLLDLPTPQPPPEICFRSLWLVLSFAFQLSYFTTIYYCMCAVQLKLINCFTYANFKPYPRLKRDKFNSRLYI